MEEKNYKFMCEKLVSFLRPYEYFKATDRFGIFDKGLSAPLPQKTSMSLEEMIHNNVVSNKCIAWSGGVDSTALVCAHLESGAKFSIICTPQSLIDGKYFYEWIRKRADIKIVDSYSDFKENNIITGYGADLLFAPNYERFKRKDGKNIIPEIYHFELKEKAKSLFNIDLQTDFDFFNFVYKCFAYTCTMRDINISSKNDTIQSFFDKEEFNDYAFSHFSERNGKLILRHLISRVTSDNSYFDDSVLFTKGYMTYNIYTTDKDKERKYISHLGVYHNKYKQEELL